MIAARGADLVTIDAKDRMPSTDTDRYPDAAMSVVIGDPVPCTAVAVNITQLQAARFDGAKLMGPVDAAAVARVDQALRAVLDL